MNTKNKEKDNFNQKNKFVNNDNFLENIHGYSSAYDFSNEMIQNNSKKLLPKVTKKQDFEKKDYDFNYGLKDTTAGRGFGNLNISNEIRNGDASRTDTRDYREKRESQQMFDYQFSFLDRNFQNPDNIVMPIPRGGESTRKQTQLAVDTMRNPNVMYGMNQEEKNKKIDFKY